MLGLWGSFIFLFCIISNTDALQVRPWLRGDYDFQGHALRALEGPKCWYPNYYCSVTEANTQTPIVVTGGASTCYDKCNGDGTCKFFTWFKRRGVEYCYLLTECGKDYQIYDDWCKARESCFSGPSDCSTVTNNNTMCAKLDTASNLIEWQCENGGTGLNVNGYNGTLNTGARCMLSCDSWRSFRWAFKSAATYPHLLRPKKGFLFSTCQPDGSWSDVLPNDFKDNKTSLEWPSPSHLHRTTYPKPNEGSLSCGCSDLVLAWPPLNWGFQETFYYNPRDEEGASMECEDEVQNSEVAFINEFRIKSNNTCRFLCDNILVATVKCIDGKWTGEVDEGFWCYEKPKEEKMLKNGCVGCFRPSPVTEEAVRLAEFAVNQSTFPSTGENCSQPEIRNLETKIVAYDNYYHLMTLLLSCGQNKLWVCSNVLVVEEFFICPDGLCAELLNPEDIECQQPEDCPGCLFPSPVTEEAVRLADFAVNQTTFPSTGENCIQPEIRNLETQVVAGINYLMTLLLSCGQNTLWVCSNVLVFQPLPFACPEGVCAELLNPEDIWCQMIE